jgi:photosystem II stability/assembly factor-like uncharacterized protein
MPSDGPVPARFAATSVTFVSADEAFVLGTAPCAHAPCTSVVRTLDRGQSWVGLPADADGNSTRRPGQLFLTSDGGTTWRQVSF